MAYTQLLRYNPWWEKPSAIAEDPHIITFNSEAVKYVPEVILKPGILILRGPRQVGKTTLLKLKIKELLETKIPPTNVFYYSFELSRKREEIYTTILEYLDSTPTKGQRYLFLDETTTIPDWSRALKALVDQGSIKKGDCVFITGSSSLDLKEGAERLPGRGIEGNEYYYLPCSLRAYLCLKGIKLSRANLSDNRQFYALAKKHLPQLLSITKEFEQYLIHGGFLYAINHGRTELSLEKYARWLEGDFVKWGKNPLIIKEILQAVIKKEGSQFSYHAIAKETSVTSHNTIIDYFEMVGQELFLKLVQKVTLSPFTIERKKEKKAYFLDPLLLGIAEHWAEQKLPKPSIIEQVMVSNLARLTVPYFYNDGKKEIDCIMKVSTKIVGIELKWSDNIGVSDTYGVKKTDVPYILSKEILKMEHGVPVIPVSLFLALLDTKELVKRDVLTLA